MNLEGKINPLITISTNKLIELDEVIGVRRIQNCELSQLNGQNGAFTKKDVDRGVVLGQYCGVELSKEEYLNTYNGTNEEEMHETYLFQLHFPHLQQFF